MFELNDIFEAYYDCRKNKRSTASAIEFEIEFDTNCIRLHSELNDRSYQVSESIAFIVTKPRRREIFAANFRDRVLHHLVDMKIRSLLELEFTDRTFNNRKGKGTSKCIEQLDRDIKTVSKNYKQDCWIAKMDMKGFFMSINKPILIKKILEFIDEKYEGADKEDLKWLVETILNDNPEKHCYLKSPTSEWSTLEADKSLFTVGDDLGLPIGNLISQLLANFYLNDFDHYVTETLRFKYYGRYVDDFYIVSTEKERMLASIPGIRVKLKEVGITLHPHKFYFQHYSKGAELVGAVIKPGRIYVHNRTLYNAKLNIASIAKEKAPATERDVARINSYLGFMVNYNSYAIRRELALKAVERKGLMVTSKFKKVELINKYKNKEIIREKLTSKYLTNKRKRNGKNKPDQQQVWCNS